MIDDKIRTKMYITEEKDTKIIKIQLKVSELDLVGKWKILCKFLW